MPNQLVKSKKTDKPLIYEADGEQVKLSPQIIKNYLVSGNGNITDQEAILFLNLCRYQKLNPFTRDAYLIKYGNQPATMVTGKNTFMKRARMQKDFQGFKAGIVVFNQRENRIVEREGTLKFENEILVGGWAEIYVAGYITPVKNTASFDEYAGKTKDGKLNSQWASKPGTMIRKVALTQALREAFPVAYAGLYSPEEMAVEDLPENKIEQPGGVQTSEMNEEPAAVVVEAEAVEVVEMPAESADDLSDLFD